MQTPQKVPKIAHLQNTHTCKPPKKYPKSKNKDQNKKPNQKKKKKFQTMKPQNPKIKP